MARLESVRLDAAGRRRSAVFTLTGRLVWEASDRSRNGAEMLFLFRGRDRGADDVLLNHVVWITKSRSDTGVDGPVSWRVTADGPAWSDFELRVENSNDFFWGRRFNEDIPGRDEVYARLGVQDSNGVRIADGVESNVVTGRF